MLASLIIKSLHRSRSFPINKVIIGKMEKLPLYVFIKKEDDLNRHVCRVSL